jgi:flagellar hook-basal body complex protein FliE
MNITPTPITTGITPISSPFEPTPSSAPQRIPGHQPTFLDVFTQIFDDTVRMQGITADDRIRLVLGEVDDLEQIMLNKEKAGIALDLLVNVRNTVLDSYNEIIRMQI